MMYEIDELANIVAMANDLEQTALTEDIRKNGQREPAVLWQGRIVDGRCRQLACHALDVDLEVRELDSNLSRDQVAEIVKSLNTRRNLTDTQKAMSAFKQQQETGEPNAVIARKWGVPLGTYKNAKYLGTHRPEYVEPLFNGKSIKIIDPDKGYEVTTRKINTIARIIKREKEKEVVIADVSEEVEFTVDGAIKTEAGKEWYYSTVNTLGITDVAVRLLMVELANLKFKQV